MSSFSEKRRGLLGQLPSRRYKDQSTFVTAGLAGVVICLFSLYFALARSSIPESRLAQTVLSKALRSTVGMTIEPGASIPQRAFNSQIYSLPNQESSFSSWISSLAKETPVIPGSHGVSITSFCPPPGLKNIDQTLISTSCDIVIFLSPKTIYVYPIHGEKHAGSPSYTTSRIPVGFCFDCRGVYFGPELFKIGGHKGKYSLDSPINLVSWF